MSGFELGQRVRYSEHIERRSSRPGEFLGPNKIWSSATYPGGKPLAGGEGIIIGKRTLSNGDANYIGYEGGIVYSPKEHFAAYVIAYDLRRKPVHVLPEHIEAIP